MKLVLGYLTIINLICASYASAAIVKVKEAIIPSGFKNINLVCEVSGLYKSEIEEQGKRIEQINFKVGPEDKPIARESGSTDSRFNLDFYWQLTDNGPNLESESADKSKLTYNVSIGINNNDQDTIKKLAQMGAVSVRAYFRYKGDDGATVEGKGTASIFLENPVEAPSGLQISSLHKGLGVNWDVAPTVKHTDDKAYRVNNVLVMLFKNGESEIELKAKKATNQNEADPEFEGCRYVAGQENCIQCEGNAEGVYLSSDQGDLQNGPLIFSLANNEKGSFSFNNLDPNTSYTVALQYEDGTKRSICKEGSSILSLSLTEANGEDDGKLSDTRCFIATAAFGSPFHQHVEVFRWFRSSILLKTSLGRKLVSFYYKNSPVIADFIAKSDALRSMTRGILLIPAYLLHGIRLLSQSKLAILSMFAVVSSILLGLYQASRLSASRKP